MSNALIPIPTVPVAVRDATLADVPFIDALQKLHNEALGFMRTSWIEEKVEAGQILVAESNSDSPQKHGDTEVRLESERASVPRCLRGEKLGYVMGVDRYFKRDDVGIVHQMNIVPGRQRGFVGATLLKAMFDRAAYGCRLFCCWCAQDLEANKFWEATGFIPLAYRAGSEKKGRVHIFWQKRIREGDATTPWWFPAKTDAGAMNAGRLVLPIPMGLHWSDELPVIVPLDGNPKLEAPNDKQIRNSKSTIQNPSGPVRHGPRQFGPPGAKPAVERVEPAPQSAKPKRVKQKCDPKLIAAVRELRDRRLEQINSGEEMIEAFGKYDVVRVLPESPAQGKLLAA